MKASKTAVLLFSSTLAVFAYVYPNAHAVVTATLTVDSYAGWNAGEAKGSFVTSLGELKPGWTTKRVAMEVDGIWSAVDAGNAGIVVGTDNRGTLYRIKGDKVSKLATIPKVVAVISLATRGDTIYAGTMPAGEIWRVNANTGNATKLATIDKAESIWSLTLNAAGNHLYAGVGPVGNLVRVNIANGNSKVVFETGDKRVMSVVAARDGSIWLGTSEKALVFRYDPKRGKARAVADFSGNEITDMAELGGGMVVIANDFAEPAATGLKSKAALEKAKNAPKGEKPKMPKTGSAPGADKKRERTPSRKGGRKGTGALFRVGGDGSLEQLHALSRSYFTSVQVTEHGKIFAGAGDRGHIYLVDTDNSVSTAFDIDDRMIAEMIYRPGRGLVFATGDAASLHRTVGPAKTAEYTSKVFDTKVSSRYGRFSWRGVGKVTAETRSGNTAKPDSGWSNWVVPRGIARTAGDASSGRIASPPGRYIQFRLRFNGDPSAVVRYASMYYLPRNRATRVESVAVAPEASKMATLKSGAASARSPTMRLSWKITNADNDNTEYTLSVRREGEVLWRKINTGPKPLTDKRYKWNTETYPDGYYRLRVTASDRRQNSADRARESHKTTPLFLVDNQKPRVEGIKVQYPNASARANDSMSNVAEMAFSIDDGPWHVGTTSDGLFDDSLEILRIDLPTDLRPGIHTLAIRVADEAGNIGSASTSFRVQ